MHSSRMRTNRCNGCFGSLCLGGLCPWGFSLGDLCPVSVSVQKKVLCPGGLYPSLSGGSLSGRPPPSVNRMTDTRFWKHYLPLRSVIIGYCPKLRGWRPRLGNLRSATGIQYLVSPEAPGSIACWTRRSLLSLHSLLYIVQTNRTTPRFRPEFLIQVSPGNPPLNKTIRVGEWNCTLGKIVRSLVDICNERFISA